MVRDFFTADLVTILFCTEDCGLAAAVGVVGFAEPLLGAGAACVIFLLPATGTLTLAGDAFFVPVDFRAATFGFSEAFLADLAAGLLGVAFLDSAPFSRPSKPEAPAPLAAAGFFDPDFVGLAAFLAVIVLSTHKKRAGNVSAKAGVIHPSPMAVNERRQAGKSHWELRHPPLRATLRRAPGVLPPRAPQTRQSAETTVFSCSGISDGPIRGKTMLTRTPSFGRLASSIVPPSVWLTRL